MSAMDSATSSAGPITEERSSSITFHECVTHLGIPRSEAESRLKAAFCCYACNTTIGTGERGYLVRVKGAGEPVAYGFVHSHHLDGHAIVAGVELWDALRQMLGVSPVEGKGPAVSQVIAERIARKKKKRNREKRPLRLPKHLRKR